MAEWYFGNGEYDGCEKVESLESFEAKHPHVNKTYEGKPTDKLVATYLGGDGCVARIYN